jgi:hypothetical protein
VREHRLIVPGSKILDVALMSTKLRYARHFDALGIRCGNNYENDGDHDPCAVNEELVPSLKKIIYYI